jgi:6-phosphofructokinase 2
METIVTLTMNPALDVSTDADAVFPGEKLRCSATVLDPGGGGVNVSRVIHRLGGPTRAVYVAGGLTGGVYTELVDGEGFPSVRVAIDGQTRESFTVTETSTGHQYRFVLQGPVLTQQDISRVIDVLDRELQPGDWLVASGSLPPGVPDSFYGDIAARYQDAGIKVVVDTSPPWLEAAIAGGVYVVKPSRHELEQYLGRELPDLNSQVVGGREMMTRSGATFVALSLGKEGALLVSRDAAWHAVAPGVVPVSTVGAGDSFLAGLIAAMHSGMSGEEALARAVAAGSATAMTPATKLCDEPQVADLLGRVVSTTIGP